jgi:two-component system LytT family response regulator
MDGFEVVEIKDIIRLEGDGNYTRFIVKDQGKIMSSKNLGEYENLLTDYGFFRIHQSVIVNLRHVVGFQKVEGGHVKTSDGALCKLSRYRKADFMRRFL